jgi:hypothetical protein
VNHEESQQLTTFWPWDLLETDLLSKHATSIQDLHNLPDFILDP